MPVGIFRYRPRNIPKRVFILSKSQETSLTVNDAFVTSQVDIFKTTKQTALVVNDAFCTSQVDVRPITKQSAIVVNDAFCTSQVDTRTLTKQTSLVVNDASCTSQVDTFAIVKVTMVKLKPSTDVTDGTWTNESGNNTNLYDSVNETSYSDADYIQSNVNPVTSPVVLKLEEAFDPNVSTGHTLRYRYERVPAGSGNASLTVQLRQGYVNESSQGTLIAEWTHTNIGDTFANAAQTLTGGQTDSITDYSSLFVRMVANA